MSRDKPNTKENSDGGTLGNFKSAPD